MDKGTGVGMRHGRKGLQNENRSLCMCRVQGDRVSVMAAGVPFWTPCGWWMIGS